MPRNRVRYLRLSTAYVEMVHDGLVAKYWPFDEPVRPGEHRGAHLLDSAVNRPFQSAFGKSIHRTILDKAAALFHSLVTNHPFSNGNKRTAVIAVDQFLLAHAYFLALAAGDVYRLAKETARHNEQGIPATLMLKRIKQIFRTYAIKLTLIGGSREMEELKARLMEHRKSIRKVIRSYS